jgi:hypothetical protein
MLETIVNIKINGKVYTLKVRFPDNINLKKETWSNEIELIPMGEAPDVFYSNETYKNQFLSMQGVSEAIKKAIEQQLEEIKEHKTRETRINSFPF